jgi:hypothetical protein
VTDNSAGAVELRDGEGALWQLAASSVDAEPVSAEVDIVFRRQPKPVEARHRIAYRTALVVLVLSHFNRGAAKLTNLHTIMWATRTSRTRRIFKAWWYGRRFYNSPTERLDPDLQITLSLALVDGLLTPAGNGTRIRLTDKGIELARFLEAEAGLLVIEKRFLGDLERLSDASMERKLGEVPR